MIHIKIVIYVQKQKYIQKFNFDGITKCRTCLNNEEGYECLGLSFVNIKYNYWISSISSKLVTCTNFIKNKTFHFYDSTKECCGLIWFFGFFVITSILSFWIFLFIVMQKQLKKLKN